MDFFRLKDKGTSIRTEAVAGITTFMTMSYIIFVQPMVLSHAGMDFGAVMMATIISSIIAILIMGLYANYPIALAPGMGENFLFAGRTKEVHPVMWVLFFVFAFRFVVIPFLP